MDKDDVEVVKNALFFGTEKANQIAYNPTTFDGDYAIRNIRIIDENGNTSFWQAIASHNKRPRHEIESDFDKVMFEKYEALSTSSKYS